MKPLTQEQKRYLLKALQAGEFDEKELIRKLEIQKEVSESRVIFENYRDDTLASKIEENR